MNIKAAVVTLLSCFAISAAVGQEIEHDDMYFNSKDRAKLKSSRSSDLAIARVTTEEKEAAAFESDEAGINPTDSYSARNVNPEYTSRANSQVAQSDNEDYFVTNYQFNQQRQFNQFGNNFNSWYNNPWYTASYWGPGLGSWYTPYYSGAYSNYYGGFYDPWMSPWNNPYSYRSGWSSSLYLGSCNFGWGNSWNSWGPMYSGWYSPYSSWYSPYGSWYGYPSRIIVVDDRDAGFVYGKRNSRSSGIAYDRYGNRSSSRTYTNRGSGSRSDTGGRISTNSTQDDYYDRTWRNNSRQGTGRASSTGDNNSGRTSTWDNNNSRSSWRDNSGSSPSYDRTPSRSSSWDGGSRSSGSSGGNSGSRSSRGRN